MTNGGVGRPFRKCGTSDLFAGTALLDSIPGTKYSRTAVNLVFQSLYIAPITDLLQNRNNVHDTSITRKGMHTSCRICEIARSGAYIIRLQER
jgi:hypothetical protein